MKINFIVPGEAVPYMRLTRGQVKLMRIPDSRLPIDYVLIKNHIRKRINYKELIAVSAVRAWGNAGPTTKPVSLSLRIFKEVPRSFPKQKRDLCIVNKIRPTTRPDASNYLKIFEDSITGVIWRDDSQVVDARVQKFYASKSYAEVEIEIL